MRANRATVNVLLAKTDERRPETQDPNPSIAPPTVTTEAIPIMMPSRVRKVRSLCVQMESTAMQQASQRAVRELLLLELLFAEEATWNPDFEGFVSINSNYCGDTAYPTHVVNTVENPDMFRF